MRILRITLLLAQIASSRTQMGVVTGELLRFDGTPAAGVRVAVTPVTDTGALLSLSQTDSAGRFRLENIPPADYYVQAGLLDSPNYFPGMTSPDKAARIAVKPGAVVELGEFRMVRPPGAWISGRIPQNGEVRPKTVLVIPNQAAFVSILGTSSITQMRIALTERPKFIFNGTLNGSPQTAIPINDDGAFEILGMRPGTYVLAVALANPALQATIVVEDRDIEIHTGFDKGVTIAGRLGLKPARRLANQKLVLTGPVWSDLETTTSNDV